MVNKNVIVKINRFFKLDPLVNPKLYSYYKSFDFKNKNVIDYITRKSAIFNSNLSSNEIIKQAQVANLSIVDYKKTLLKNSDKFHTNSGLFQLLDNHRFQLIEKDEAKKILRNNQDQQIVWDMEMSFIASDLETIGVVDQKQYAQFFVEHFPKLLAKENLDINNLNLFFTIHSNTSNPHYHIVFSEKKPKFVNQNNQKIFKTKGKFDPQNLQNFRQYLSLQLEGQKAIESLYETKKTIWDNRKAVIKNIDYNLVKNDQDFLTNIQIIKDQMVNVKNKTYARANDQVRGAVDTIKDLLLTKDKNLMAKHNELLESFNLISDKDQRQLMQDKELADLNQRFGNEIIKYALNFDPKQLLIPNSNFSHLKHLKNRYNLNKNNIWKQIIFDLTKLPYKLYELKKAFIVGKNKIDKLQKQEQELN